MLGPGDTAPSFTGVDQDGEAISLQDLLGGWLVLFFYPKDETYGCTIQACSHRDSIEEYRAAGIKVLGVSTDDQISHARFADKENLPFPLVADPDKAICRAYGTLGLLGRAKRVSFLIDPVGVIRFQVAGLTPGQHKAENLIPKLRELGAPI